jgi:hypothetical protein
MDIGSALGRFIVVEDNLLGAQDRKISRVLVEVDIHNGLLETLEIQWRDQVIVKNLDYLGIPLCCSLCRWMGLLRNSC